MRPEVRYARNGEVSLAYQVVGEGTVDLVWIPGFVSHLEVIWEEPSSARFIERLASFARVVLWDKREQGLSDRLGCAPTLEDTMEDLRAVLDAAAVERATVLGTAEGGPAAMLFAATYPARVERLVLYGTFARMAQAEDFEPGVTDDFRTDFLDRFDVAFGGPVALEIFAPSVAGDVRFQGWWARLLRSGTTPRSVLDLIEMCFALDVRPVLPALLVPTLVLHRADDHAAPVVQGRYLASAIPGARYVELQGHDHLPMVGDAEAVLDEIEEFVTGRRGEREPERVLSTVLFTDIVGSTERAAALGDRLWRDLLASHDAAVARVIERFRGRLVKTTGDGALATFEGPARAIRCAAKIREELAELGVEVRAGIHTGEVEVLDADIGGLGVHIGARVAARAVAGEVLVSRTVRDLVAGSGLEFHSRGSHDLKGVPGEWELFALDGAP